MKQKIVIKVSMTGEKCRAKALKTAVGVPGVESASLKGDEKNQVEVIGDNIDAVHLMRMLRKNVGSAELVSVGPPEAKKDDDKNKEVTTHPLIWTPTPYEVHYEVPYYNRDPVCSIM